MTLLPGTASKGLSIKYNKAEPRVRSLNVLVGVAGTERTLKINNADIHTLAAALLERMYYCKVDGEFIPPPTVKSTHIRSVLNPFRNVVRKCFGPNPLRLSPIEFVEMFQGRKRTIYENALVEYYETGPLDKHAISVIFVKCEKVPPGSAPRCIQPRNAVYNIGLGSYLKHIEHRIYHAIGNAFGEEDPVVAKGLNVEELGAVITRKWNHFNNPVAVGMDATKFDMHVSAEMLEWEHSLYKMLYPNDKELNRLLKYQINNKGVGYCDDGSLRYKVRGRRFSGDMNTALGNCLIMCGMVYAYAKEKQIPIKFINNGDDCVVFMERENYTKFSIGLKEWFLNLGFRMVVELPVYNLAQVEFCQMRCLRTIRGPVMVRNFDKAREKDSASFLPLNGERETRKWLWAVGECGLALTGGVPVFQEFYKWYMRHGVAGRTNNSVQMTSGAMFLAQRLESKECTISDEARLDFMEAWGLTPDEQISLEEYYTKLDFTYNKIHIDNYDQVHGAPL
jgi:hypothetical protein